jgi:hypothetical protein
MRRPLFRDKLTFGCGVALRVAANKYARLVFGSNKNVKANP